MIINRLNYVYFIILGITIMLILLLWLLLRKKSEKVKSIVIASMCIFDIVFFFVYKYWLSIDPKFLELAGLTKFNWWNELPLQLCNISLFLIPIGVLTNNKFLKSYCFYITPLGALMAITFPEPAFVNDSVFALRNIGFYGTHMILIISGMSLLTLKLYKPSYKEIWLPTLVTLCLALIMFGVNTILRNTVCPEANYFFTYKCDVPLLSTFYKIIPVPMLYLLLSVFILVPYCLLITFIYNLYYKIKDKVHKNDKLSNNENNNKACD